MDFSRARHSRIFDQATVRTALLVGLGYYAGSLVGLGLRSPSTVTSILWPPNAILTAALIVTPTRRWPAALLGALFAHVASQLMADWSVSLIVALFATNCSEALIAAAMLRILSDAPARIDTFRRFGTFLCSAVVAAPLLSTFGDAAAVAWLHGDPYWLVWWNRFPANTLAQLTVTPVIVGVLTSLHANRRAEKFGRLGCRFARRPSGRYAEAAALGTCFLGSSWLALTPLGSQSILANATDSLLVAQLPFVLWTALRFGPVGTSLALLGTTSLSTWVVVHGGDTEPSALALQVGLVVIAVTLLGLATLLEERRQSMHTLRERLEFEQLLSAFSRAFVQVSSEQMNAMCREWLGRIGRFLDVERLWLLQVRLSRVGPKYADIVIVSDWRRSTDLPPLPVDVKHELPWALSSVLVHRALVLPNLKSLPPEAARDRSSLEAHGIRAALVLPLLIGGRLAGALLCGSARERTWPEDEISKLRLLSEVLGNALARQLVDDDLKEGEVMKSAILDSLTSGVAVLDRDGRLLSLNSNWIRFAGESGTVPYVAIREGDRLLDVFPSDVTAGVKAVLNRAVTRFATEFATVTTDGTQWWMFVVSCLNRPEGGAVVTLADVTEQRRAEIEAQQVREELAHVGRVATMGELTASLAHQINQPLTGVMINAQAARRLLDRTPLDYRELRETMSDILEDARRANEVIQGVRGLMRRSEFEMTQVDLRDVIRNVASLVASDAIIRNITIALDLDPQPVVVRGDRVQLQQVVLNLLVNGMEAIRKDAEERVVHVSCRRTDGRDVRVIVRDSGVGLAEGAEKRMFDPFYTTKANGMGMGLSIAQSIVETHNGSISARNAGTRGTVVEFTLPLAESPELV